MDLIIWILIAVCISQSAMFSGLNLAFFSISKLTLELEMSKNNPLAFPIAKLRDDSNFLLATILWGNVAVNVLLAMLSDMVLAGVIAFLFSTFLITIVGEIIPQAYLSRNAMRAASFLAPAIRFYQILLYPFAKPTALILNRWLGNESIEYVHEKDIIALIEYQKDKESITNVSEIASQGMINILDFNKTPLSTIGQTIAPDNIIEFSNQQGENALPAKGSLELDDFIAKTKESSGEWIILTDSSGQPHYVLNNNAFQAALFKEIDPELRDYCTSPLVLTSSEGTFLDALNILQKDSSNVVLVWETEEKRIITDYHALKLISKGIF